MTQSSASSFCGRGVCLTFRATVQAAGVEFRSMSIPGVARWRVRKSGSFVKSSFFDEAIFRWMRYSNLDTTRLLEYNATRSLPSQVTLRTLPRITSVLSSTCVWDTWWRGRWINDRWHRNTSTSLWKQILQSQVSLRASCRGRLGNWRCRGNWGQEDVPQTHQDPEQRYDSKYFEPAHQTWLDFDHWLLEGLQWYCRNAVSVTSNGKPQQDFQDELTGACTNHIEGTWAAIKGKTPVRNRTESNIDGHLSEFIWRRKNREHLWESLLSAFSEIRYWLKFSLPKRDEVNLVN